MTGRVTAIVSAYYSGQYLNGRIENLLAQDEKPAIIVIAQSGSAEHEIMKEYPQAETILTADIPSVYQAWNMGIKAANTPYITNANSDDRLYPGALKKMCDVLDKETTYGLVYANVDVVEEIDGEVIRQFNWKEGGFSEIMKGCFIGPMPVWRRQLHDRFGYFDEIYRSAGDYEFWIRLAKNGVKFYHLRGDSLGAYLERPDSVEHRESLLTLWETNNIRMKYREAQP